MIIFNEFVGILFIVLIGITSVILVTFIYEISTIWILILLCSIGPSHELLLVNIDFVSFTYFGIAAEICEFGKSSLPQRIEGIARHSEKIQ